MLFCKLINMSSSLENLIPYEKAVFLLKKVENLYKNAVHPSLIIIFQFMLWYITLHTGYWGIEQLRFKWCVPCGLSGYMQSLIVSQSLICKLLTELSSAMSTYQISNLTMLSSFIGLKCIPLFNKNSDEKESIESSDKTKDDENI